MINKSIKSILDKHQVEESENLSNALEEIFVKLASDPRFTQSISKAVSENLAREASSSRGWRTF